MTEPRADLANELANRAMARDAEAKHDPSNGQFTGGGGGSEGGGKPIPKRASGNPAKEGAIAAGFKGSTPAEQGAIAARQEKSSGGASHLEKAGARLARTGLGGVEQAKAWAKENSLSPEDTAQVMKGFHGESGKVKASSAGERTGKPLGGLASRH